MCVPCEEKRRLNEKSQGIVDAGERWRRDVEKRVDKGRLTEAQAANILAPLMAADRAYSALGEIAEQEAQRRFAEIVG